VPLLASFSVRNFSAVHFYFVIAPRCTYRDG
jgi:hypothetical protein